MIHWNEAMRMHGALWLVELFYPEGYSATTLTDFVKHRHEVKPTRKIFPLGCFFNGEALVDIESRVTCSEVNEERVCIRDMNGGLGVYLDKELSSEIRKKKRAMPRVGDSLYEVLLGYNPRKDKAYLIDYEDKGPAQGSRVRKGIFSSAFAPAPAFV